MRGRGIESVRDCPVARSVTSCGAWFVPWYVARLGGYGMPEWFRRNAPMAASANGLKNDSIVAEETSGSLDGPIAIIPAVFRSHNLLAFLTIPVLLAILLSPVLAGHRRLAFRDVGYFYTPLYGYIAQRSSWSGGVPLWNPLDGAGMPMAGEVSTAVFYPLRIAVYAMISDPVTAIGWYTWLHLTIASVAMGCLVAVYQSSQLNEDRGRRVWTILLGSALYPMSGVICFLCCNTIYLVSAAYIPLAMLPLVNLRPHAFSLANAVSGVAIGTMVLGGDPQTALHCGLILLSCGVLKIVFSIGRRYKDKNKAQHPVSLLAQFARVAKSMWIIGTVALLVALPQLAAGMDWLSHSGRTDQLTSASVNLAETFVYSVAPWHSLEWLTPNAWGTLFPRNARLSKLIPSDSAIWVMSMFSGTLPVLLLLSLINRRVIRPFTDSNTHPNGDVKVRGLLPWMPMAAVAYLLSMGDWAMPASVGSPYQWLSETVPGYSHFRYPAKWLPFVVVGLTMATTSAIGSVAPSAIKRGAAVMGVIIFAHAVWVIFLSTHTTTHTDSWWGPLQIILARDQILRSLLYSILSLLVLAWMMTQHSMRSASRYLPLIVFWTIIELSFFCYQNIPTINRDQEQRLISSAPATSFEDIDGTEGRQLRQSSSKQWPQSWRTQSDSRRLMTVETSLRLIRFGRWHLSIGMPVCNSMVSIENAAINRLFRQPFGSGGGADFARTSYLSLLEAAGCQGRWIESGKTIQIENQTIMVPRQQSISSRSVLIEPGEREMLRGPAIVRRDVYQDGHWKVRLQDQRGATIWRVPTADSLGQTVDVPAGNWTADWIYRPSWFRPIMVLWIASIIGLVIVGFRNYVGGLHKSHCTSEISHLERPPRIENQIDVAASVGSGCPVTLLHWIFRCDVFRRGQPRFNAGGNGGLRSIGLDAGDTLVGVAIASPTRILATARHRPGGCRRDGDCRDQAQADRDGSTGTGDFDRGNRRDAIISRSKSLEQFGKFTVQIETILSHHSV